jgi:hypothetical protein
MYHPDLREEIKFLKARLLYKTKKLNEAVAANDDPEKVNALTTDVAEIQEKLSLCQTEVDAQDKNEDDEWQQSHKE